MRCSCRAWDLDVCWCRSIGGALGALILAAAPTWGRYGLSVIGFALACEAAMLSIVQVAFYSLAVHIFPPEIRATGVGASGGVGRLGALLSAFTAAAGLEIASVAGYFFTITIGMLCTALFLSLLRPHIEPTVRTADMRVLRRARRDDVG